MPLYCRKQPCSLTNNSYSYLSLYGAFGEYSQQLPWNWNFMNSIRKIRAKVQEKIDERRKEGSKVTDLLSLMLSIKDEETGQVLVSGFLFKSCSYSLTNL